MYDELTIDIEAEVVGPKPPPEAGVLRIYNKLYDYPKPWKKGMCQKHIMKWADETCETCGTTREDSLIHIHHLRWKAKHDCRFENLVAVCTKCHVTIHNRGWQPDKPWKKRWGTVPAWLAIRGIEVEVIDE